MKGIAPGVLMAWCADGNAVPMAVGVSVDSCTSTAAAVAYWLSPPADGQPRDLSELALEHGAVPLSSLGSDAAVAELLRPAMGAEARLLVFSTAPHKFAVLCCGGRAVLIQSNQDDTRGGRRFTLADWLASAVPLWSMEQLSAFIRRLGDAATGAADHQEVCAEYFGGARFVRGEPSSYWVVSLPVSAPAASHLQKIRRQAAGRAHSGREQESSPCQA